MSEQPTRRQILKGAAAVGAATAGASVLAACGDDSGDNLTERFDESLIMLAQWLQEPDFPPAYRSRNRLADKRRPQDRQRERLDMSYFDSESVRGRIEEANREDQKVYDFVTTNIYPRQVANFQGDLAAELEALKTKNRTLGKWSESFSSFFLRNYIYKPLLHVYAV